MYRLKSLDSIHTEAGYVQKFIDSTQDEFLGFGEVYFSILENMMPRPMKKHTKVTMNLLVVSGRIEFNFESEGSKALLLMDSKKPELLTVSPGVWFSFRNIDRLPAILCNLIDVAHNDSEVVRR